MIKPIGYDTIILIGPIGVGKSTVGKLLASRLDCPFTSLDDLELGYINKLGYDHDLAMKIAHQEGGFPFYEYRRSFFEEAVIQFLEEHQHGVLEMGGGHPIMPKGANQQRISETLKAFRNVILLMPKQEVEESISLLRAQQGLPAEADDFNELYFESNIFNDVSNYIIYTWGKSPEEITEEILTTIDDSKELG